MYKTTFHIGGSLLQLSAQAAKPVRQFCRISQSMSSQIANIYPVKGCQDNIDGIKRIAGHYADCFDNGHKNCLHKCIMETV